MRGMMLGSFVLALMLSCAMGAPRAWALPLAPTPLRVVIDPGHGGIDAGAVVGPVREADLVLSVSRELSQLLAQDSRFQVTMTRTQDVRLGLPDRLEKAEKAKADLFVSLHMNTSNDPRVRGMEVYIQNHLPPEDDLLEIANLENQKEVWSSTRQNTSELSKAADLQRIIEDLKREGRLRASHRLSRHFAQSWNQSKVSAARPIRQAPFYVINRASFPAALIELGFLTHDKERQRLGEPDTHSAMAKSIYDGLVSYLLDKDLTGELPSGHENRRQNSATTTSR